MSYADKIFVETCKNILANGFSDKDLHVRPRWEDGTPAHTIKKFGVVNRYDLKKQFPILTIRRTYWKSALDEVLWIWQKKSNNVQDLSSHIWDAWADETGSIGKAYGYQMGVKHHYKDGDYDQVDRVLKGLLDDFQRLGQYAQRHSQPAQSGYDHFRQGLDILDLDALPYAIIGTNRNSMGDWLPPMVEACRGTSCFRIPATVVARVPMPLLQLTRLEYHELTEEPRRKPTP